jgi:hypothetical protein
MNRPKSFQLFPGIAKIAARPAKFLMDDRSFAGCLIVVTR